MLLQASWCDFNKSSRELKGYKYTHLKIKTFGTFYSVSVEQYIGNLSPPVSLFYDFASATLMH